MQLYEHQKQDIKFYENHPIVFNQSDPGTGKTAVAIAAIAKNVDKGRTLVLCPKSIMEPSWGEDIRKFAPWVTYNCAYADNRATAFKVKSDVVITNHDAVSWIIKHPEVLLGFYQLIIDESTAYKHRTSERSKAVKTIAALFQTKSLMTGTPFTNCIDELWHQTYLLDDGERLGESYYRFRNKYCTPVQNGRFQKWVSKPTAKEDVAELLKDITVRNVLEECIDIPPNHTYTVDFEMDTQHREYYEQLRNDSLLELDDTNKITSLHAATLNQKLLQTAAGMVYGDNGTVFLSRKRLELIADLVEQREHSIIAVNWNHMIKELSEVLKKRKISFSIINGEVVGDKRNKIVQDYQKGKYKTLIINPKAASHGLTFTRGTATIWSGPVYDLEHFYQFNRRIYRATQTQKTETILVCAKDTLEAGVYRALSNKEEALNHYLLLQGA